MRLYGKTLQDLKSNFFRVYQLLISIELLRIAITYLFSRMLRVRGGLHSFSNMALNITAVSYSTIVINLVLSLLSAFVIMELLKSLSYNKKLMVSDVFVNAKTNLKYVINAILYISFIISLYITIFLSIAIHVPLVIKFILLLVLYYMVLRISFALIIFYLEDLNIHESMTLSHKLFDVAPGKIFFFTLGMMIPFILIGVGIKFVKLLTLKGHLHYPYLMKSLPFVEFFINPLFVLVISLTLFNLYKTYRKKI